MKRDGKFSLVELLAVVSVLGLMVVIGIVTVNTIIKGSRIKQFRVSEENIIDAVKYYIPGEEVDTPLNVDDFLEITYDDLIQRDYINKIVDPKDKTECINSSVIVKKIGEYEFEYIPKLVCSNYISIDGLDYIDLKGEFEEDSDLDGVADFWNFIPNSDSLEGSAKRLSKVYSIKENSQYGYWPKVQNEQLKPFLGAGFVTDVIEGIDPTHIYYFETQIKRVKGKGYAGIDLYNVTSKISSMGMGVPSNIGMWSQVESWINVSNTNSKIGDTFKLYIYLSSGDNVLSNEMEIRGYIDNCYLLDLTELYGVGREPTKEEMIEIMDNSIY